MLSSFVITLLSSLMLSRMSYVISEKNVGTIYNGLGCSQQVINKTAEAPMAYRVLFPLLVNKIPNNLRLLAYFFFHSLFIFLMLLTCNFLFGIKVMLILSLLIPLTIRYDYWDWIPELAAIISCVSGNIYFALCWSILAAASKETSIILPLVWITSSHSIDGALLLSASTFSTFYLVRKWQGKKKKYCETIMLDRNGHELKAWMNSTLYPINFAGEAWESSKFKNVFDDMTMTVLLTISAIFAIAHFGLPFSIPIIAFLLAGWTLAIARETRVFTPILFYLALWAASV